MLKSPELGEVMHDENPIGGTIAVYKCENGISGDIDTRNCSCNGEWSQPEPVCRAGT